MLIIGIYTAWTSSFGSLCNKRIICFRIFKYNEP